MLHAQMCLSQRFAGLPTTPFKPLGLGLAASQGIVAPAATQPGKSSRWIAAHSLGSGQLREEIRALPGKSAAVKPEGLTRTDSMVRGQACWAPLLGLLDWHL